MSQTLAISAPLVMSAVPALLVTGGLIVGWFLRGDLATNIEVARLNADNDARTARWLWLRGYRLTPHAGPDVTDDMPAIEAEPKHVDGEVLRVEHPTSEIVRPTLADLAEEVALVQATTCCDGHMSEECNGYGELSEACCEQCPDWDWTPQPNPLFRAISDEPEHDDEDAPADDTDRPGLHLVLLAVPVALWDRLAEWWQSLWAARHERHMVGSGEQATAGDPFAELLAHVEDSATTDAEEREVLDEAWRAAVAAARAEAAPRHASDELAQDTGYRGSRWKPGTEHTGLHPIVVPAQRDGGES